MSYRDDVVRGWLDALRRLRQDEEADGCMAPGCDGPLQVRIMTSLAGPGQLLVYPHGVYIGVDELHAPEGAACADHARMILGKLPRESITSVRISLEDPDADYSYLQFESDAERDQFRAQMIADNVIMRDLIAAWPTAEVG